MQQLTLFSSSSRRVGVRKRIRNQSMAGQQELVAGWDLFSQATVPEKELALFFLDIRNFTPLAERRPAFDMIHLVKKLFSTFQNIIRIYHGRIIETNGDGFYAAFGFQGNVDQAANDAVRAGTTILRSLRHLNKESFEDNLGQRIDVGIGIHVGKVATGRLHLGTKEHFVVMGYAVNIASRIQAATKELNNNFIVSADVFTKLHDPIPDILPLTTRLKGVSEPCVVYPIGERYGLVA